MGCKYTSEENMSSAILIFMDDAESVSPIDTINPDNQYFFVCAGIDDARIEDIKTQYYSNKNIHFTSISNEYFKDIKMTSRLDRFESALCLMYFTHLKSLPSKKGVQNAIWVTCGKTNKIAKIEELMEENASKFLFRDSSSEFSTIGGLKILHYESISEEMLLGSTNDGIFHVD